MKGISYLLTRLFITLTYIPSNRKFIMVAAYQHKGCASELNGEYKKNKVQKKCETNIETKTKSLFDG